MLKIFIVITVAIFDVSASEFKFSIIKHLQTSEELNRENWTHVEITDLTENDNIAVKVNVPLSIQYSEVSIFFANDTKQILQVYLNNALRGKFYAMPYKVEKELKGQNTTVVQIDKYQQISGNFPRSWLPENCNKISAAVADVHGNIYNYYWLNNFAISIPDLLVVEEYKRYFSSVSNKIR